MTSNLPKLRSHRASSLVPTTPELVELRALQRTFEGAYVRTALSQFSFSLIVLKVFTSEFYPVGALFAAFGLAIFGIAFWRRKCGNRQFFEGGMRFRTSGGVVAGVTVVSVVAYAVLLVLILRLKEV